MKIQLMLTGAAAVLLGGCTTYTTPGYSSHGTRVYSDGHDSGDYYSRDYRDGDGYYSGGYDRGGYDGQYHRQPEAQSDTVVVHEHNTTVSHPQVSHAQVSHGTSATVSHGHNGNKAAVGSSTKPGKAPSAGKHPPEKTSKSEKKTEKRTE
jgi:hypothetical protein